MVVMCERQKDGEGESGRNPEGLKNGRWMENPKGRWVRFKKEGRPIKI
jgi:hypothetical protein